MLLLAFDNIAQVGTPMDATFIYYGLINVCAHLMAPYNACDTYPSYSLTMSVIQVPLSLCPTAAMLNMRDTLQQKAHPLLLTNGQQAKLMLMGIHTAVS